MSLSPAGVQPIAPDNPFIPWKIEDIEQSIPQRFEALVRTQPDRLAVKSRQKDFTYALLNRAANRVAHALLKQRGPSEEPIPFLLEHGAAQIIAILGILKAGKMYMPLDPAFPRARTVSMLEDSQATLLITDPANQPQAKELAGKRTLLNLAQIPGDISTENPNLTISPDTKTFILYTSSTTGKAKGVVQNHRNVLHNMLKLSNGLRLCKEDRTTMLASCTFGASVSDIFGAILNGAALFPFNIKKEGLPALIDWVAGNELTIYHSVPTVFRHLSKLLDGKRAFPSLRVLKLGGEPVLASDVELYRKLCAPHTLLQIVLGATEVNVIRHLYLKHDSPLEGSRVPVGYAEPDTEITIVDEAGKPVPAGQEGEIAVKSKYLALGYWRNVELTAKSFLPAPEGDGLRVYRLGDLGKLRPDGCLEHLGRKDFQVKVRGHRVEVAEIEIALQQVPGVQEVVAGVRETKPGDKVLVAYVVAGGPKKPGVNDLRRHLHERLPDYMIPAAFVFVDQFPLTPTGKVDFLNLPLPDLRRPQLGKPYLEAKDPLQQLFVQAWEEILPVRPIGIHDRFFDLGGDSLQAVNMMARMEQLTGKKLPLSLLYEEPTIAHLSGKIKDDTSKLENYFVKVKVEPGGVPFFFLHGDYNGGGFYCVNLAHHLGPGYSFYAVHPHGLVGNDMPDMIETMAAEYLETVWQLQPNGGPFFLGGHCNGSVVAFEMARQLRMQGQEVKFLLLFDPPPKNTAVTAPVPNGSRVELANLTSEARGKAIMAAFFNAIVNYHPQQHPGLVTVFRAEEHLKVNRDLSMGWRFHAAKTEVIIVPGGHLTSLTNYSAEAAGKLRACLQKAQGKS